MAEMLEEYAHEAFDLLDDISSALISIEQGDVSKENYDEVVRSLKGLKTSSRMMGISELTNHLLMFEDRFLRFDGRLDKISKNISYFLNSTEAAKKLLNKNSFQNSISPSAKEDEEVSPIEEVINKKITEAKSVRPKLLVFLTKDNEKVESLEPYEIVKIKGTGKESDLIDECKKIRPTAILTDIDINSKENLETILKIRLTTPTVLVCHDKKDYDVAAKHLLCMIERNDLNQDLLNHLLPHQIKIIKTLSSMEKITRLLSYMYSDLKEQLVEKPDDIVKQALCDEVYIILKDYKSSQEGGKS